MGLTGGDFGRSVALLSKKHFNQVLRGEDMCNAAARWAGHFWSS
jgi:hypothetical protein